MQLTHSLWDNTKYDQLGAAAMADPKPIENTPDESPPNGRGCAGLFVLLLVVVGAAWGAGLGVFVYILEGAEDTIEAVEAFRPQIGSKVYSADGEELGEFAYEARQVVSLSEMPLILQKAFIATEDDTFYTHKGVRPLAITRAVMDAFRTNRLRGASTITQQIVRNIDKTGISTEQTFQRKIREALVALQLERQFTKDEILEMYLNQIFLGVSANGVESAARQYFLKSVGDLTLGECAMLAGLTRAPNPNSPFRSPENALTRRNIVLRQMLANQFITQEEYEAALLEDLDRSVITPEERKMFVSEEKMKWNPNKFKAPYFVEEVRQFIKKPTAPHQISATEKELYQDGLEVSTTIDMRLQQAAEEILTKRLDKFDADRLAKLTKEGREREFIPVSGALVCLDNRVGADFDYRGYVRAMVGGRNYEEQKFNMATQAKRQPGSSVKPFIWLAALDNGMTPSDYILDKQKKYVDVVGNLWEPKNFDDKYEGPMPIRKALELSKNLVSIRLTDRFKTPLIRSYLRSAGFKLPLTEGLSIALGSSDTRIIDQASCYNTLALGGIHVEPTLITKIVDRDGIVRYDADDFREFKRVFPEDVNYQVIHLMQGVCEPNPGGYSPSGRRTAGLNRPRAGKTGTSNESRNVWFCGFTPQYVCVIWIGYANNDPLGEGVAYTGGALASPVWTEFMTRAHEGLPVKDFKVPAGVEFYNINRGTGLAGGKYKEAYIRGTEPLTVKPVFEMEEELEVLGEPRMFSRGERD